ncbi:hypothetical protein V9T40_009880 [Parthenolecanium corni]|uniref:Uncharacterized protein n=1 Tax=Parthenolecanium corni TaxID=536013 RepID=A0AAN9TL72_9HEMI
MWYAWTNAVRVILKYSYQRLKVRIDVKSDTSSCLNFRLHVSFFVQLSQFSSGCLNFRLDVSFFVQLSHFSFISLARFPARF